MNPKNLKIIWIALTAGLVCLLVYFPAVKCDFINYDDSLFITNNPAIRNFDLKFIKWAFTTSYSGWWMPLVWVSFAVDYYFWGLNPYGYHLTNILLHAVNVGLVVCIADRVLRLSGFQLVHDELQEQRSKRVYFGVLLLSGLFWGLHPVNVESVAWAVERKNVLNGIFSLSCVLYYFIYLERKEVEGEKGRAIGCFIASAFLLLFALMTKPVSIVIPPILLVLDCCLFGRFQHGKILQVFAEKIPYLLLSVVVAMTTVLLAAGNSLLVPLSVYSLTNRLISTGTAIFDASLMMVYPVDIIIMYLIPNPLPTSYTIKMAAVICFTLFCLLSVRKSPWLTATWLCFLLPLLPALHFFINGAHGICAHLVYQSSIAPCIAFAAVVGLVCKKTLTMTSRLPRLLLAVVVASLLLFYVVMTNDLLKEWKNSETIWTRVINIRPVGRAYYYRALFYVEKNRYNEAIDDLQISIKMALSAGYPDVDELYALKGDALYKAGRYVEALEAFTAAISVKPRATYYYHRGDVFKALGKSREAEYDFSKAGGAVATD